MIYLTSDFHFCHNKEFLFQGRGFETIDEMNKAIIQNVNSIVMPEDILIIAGDCMLNDNEKGIECLKQLNGIKKLVIGNHDTDNRIKRYKEENIFEEIGYAIRFRYKKESFYISHYPRYTSNTDKKQVINLYGHLHSKTKINQINPQGIHIGLDSNDLKPISIEECYRIAKSGLLIIQRREYK